MSCISCSWRQLSAHRLSVPCRLPEHRYSPAIPAGARTVSRRTSSLFRLKQRAAFRHVEISDFGAVGTGKRPFRARRRARRLIHAVTPRSLPRRTAYSIVRCCYGWFVLSTLYRFRWHRESLPTYRTEQPAWQTFSACRILGLVR